MRGCNARRASALIITFSVLAMASGPSHADLECPSAIAVCSAEEIAAIPVEPLANNHWLVALTPSGYSDYVEHTQPPFIRGNPQIPEGPAPIHEMFSGEWAAAVGYNGNPPMWLEKCMRYPDWKTSSNFVIVDGVTLDATTNVDGFYDASSRIANPDLEISLRYSFKDTGIGVAMGYGSLTGPDYRLSDRYVLHQTYDIKNISGAPITDLSLFQFAASHPANTETPASDIAYDDFPHLFGGYTDFRYDMTGIATNSGLPNGFPTGSTFEDQVSLSSSTMPSAYGLGSYRGHSPGDDGVDPTTGSLKPILGLHCDVELDALANETEVLQDEIAGAMKFDLGNLAINEMKSVTVMLAMNSMAHGSPAAACLTIEDTGGDPYIRMAKGTCSGAAAAGPYDVVMGSLSQLQSFADCGAIGPDPFDCSVLTHLSCKGHAHDMDRIDLDEDAHRLDALYYLVRPSAPFTMWGEGLQPPGMNPLFRFYFTPFTAPDVDACDPIP